MNGGWWGAGGYRLPPRSLNPLLTGSLNFFRAGNQLSGGEKNCIVYRLFCIIIISIIIILSSSIYFVVLLNCLYLNLQVSPFVHFSSLFHWGGRGGVSERLSGA